MILCSSFLKFILCLFLVFDTLVASCYVTRIQETALCQTTTMNTGFFREVPLTKGTVLILFFPGVGGGGGNVSPPVWFFLYPCKYAYEHMTLLIYEFVKEQAVHFSPCKVRGGVKKTDILWPG